MRKLSCNLSSALFWPASSDVTRELFYTFPPLCTAGKEIVSFAMQAEGTILAVAHRPLNRYASDPVDSIFFKEFFTLVSSLLLQALGEDG